MISKRPVFIDRFVVPVAAYKEFHERLSYSRRFIAGIHGLVMEAASERNDGNVMVMTVAVWESEADLKMAKEAVQTEYGRIGFDPAAMMARLMITMDRGTYQEVEHPVQAG